ncbi:MAG TPA: hypothetical protein VGM90_05610 [Kofleriaceae bacterium]|jgi:hypothetical protein
MKNTVVFGATIAGLLLAGPAHAGVSDDVRGDLYELGGQIDQVWSRDGDGPWDIADGAAKDGKAVCKDMIAKAVKDGAKDTDPVSLMDDGPDFLKGDVPFGDLKLVCDRMQRMIDIKVWEKWAKFAMQELGKKSGGDIKFSENCLATYDEMLKKGVAADSKVVAKKVNDASGTPVDWKGTVKELRVKYCDAGYKKAKEEQEKRDAPYKKVMKGEKLETALTYRGVFLAGGVGTDDPAKMAAASVWFIDTEPSELCPNLTQKHVIHRYEFAGDKLAKSTNIETCGIPRASNYK